MAAFYPAYFRAQGWWRDETLGDWLDLCVSGASDRAAILSAGRTLTYAAFGADVAGFAAGLCDAGIRRGDVVVVHLPNVPEFLIAWFAINAIGEFAPAVQVAPRLNALRADHDLPPDPDTWFQGATEMAGSWWPDWQRWILASSKEQVPARQPGDGKLTPIEDAPGSYVKVRLS